MLQVVTQPPNTGIGFSQLKYEIEVMENTPQEAVLHTLTLRHAGGHTELFEPASFFQTWRPKSKEP